MQFPLAPSYGFSIFFFTFRYLVTTGLLFYFPFSFALDVVIDGSCAVLRLPSARTND
jgi:hypothetical protein